ncbi:hypothetical protein [Streptomyces sp. NPDC002044]|uniref:hypothetical protein n=1 Tax=Streptomyces sp. NPDC002044 TaxID=3154662 RepID=UPI00331B4C1D
MSDLPRDRGLPPCALDAVVEDASVLGEEYAGYDEYAARCRIARRVVAHRARPAAGAGPGCGPGAGGPGTARSAGTGHLVLDAACHVRAARTLDETARALVESGDYAERALGAGSWPHSAESTLLFAGLLHLAGENEGARFWFQYAAGAGSRTAARCLYLHHLARAEAATARHWHDQSRQLPEEAGLPELPPVPHDLEEALAASVIWTSPPITTQDLTALTAGPGRARRTGYRLPPHLRLAATGHTWTGDPDLGEVFLPAPRLAHALADRARLPHARRPALARAAGTLLRANLATPAGPDAHAPGGTPRPDGGRGSVRESLAWLRGAVGAAFYVARYTDGEVSLTRYADGPATPAVDEWVDFRAAAHASAHTLGSREALFRRLDTRRPNAPPPDLEEYAPDTVRAAVPTTAGPNTECVALSLPVPGPGRPERAARVPRRAGDDEAGDYADARRGDPP